MRFFIAVLAISTLAAAAQPDWNQITQETLQYYQALVRMNTSGGPDFETPAVVYIKKILDGQGIPAQVFASDPNHPNIVARIKGTGARKPVIVMGHTDTVNVDPAKWTFPPFSAARDKGYIYGRGTLDDRDNLVASLMTVILLKRMNVKLDRDVIFIAEAGEESNSGIGIQSLVNEHWPEIEAEYCLAEGGGVMRRDGKMVSMIVTTTEKVPARAQLVAHGTAGHGSIPRDDNAIAHLSKAIAKVTTWQPPMKLNDTTRAFFERLAAISPPERAAHYNGLLVPERSTAAQEYLRHNEPMLYSTLRTSISPTVIQGGYRMNVIPAQAEATLDIRAVPDEDIDAFYAELKRQIGDDSVQIIPAKRERQPAAPSRIDTEMFRTLESVQKKIYPGAITLPSMLTGATDMAQLRAKGVECYGIGPLTDVEDMDKGFGPHSDQERLIEDELYRFVRFQYEVVREIGNR